MKSVKVQLERPEKVKRFVHITGNYAYPIDLRCGRHMVDAKSLLGIFSMDITRPMTMEIYEDNCEDLLHEITPYVVA